MIGIEKGLQQGIKQGLLRAIKLGLELKFGAEGLKIYPERHLQNLLPQARLRIRFYFSAGKDGNGSLAALPKLKIELFAKVYQR